MLSLRVLLLVWLLRYSYGSECIDELIKFANNTLEIIAGGEADEITQKRLAYSGANLGYLGKFRLCNNLADSKYTLFYQEVLDGPLSLYLALCLPKACSKDDYQSVLDNVDLAPLLKKFADNKLFGIPLDGIITKGPSVTFPFDDILDYSIDAVGWIVVVIWFILIAVGLTVFVLVDIGVISQESIINIFHTRKNAQAIFSPCDGQKRPINAVRAFSISWMNLCASLFMLSCYAATTNPQDIPHYERTYFFACVYCGHLGANTFLWISGFLVAYRYKDSIPSLRDIPLRLLRILPVSWLAMFLTWKVVPYGVFIESPLWWRYSDLFDDCHQYWWTNILMVSNFVPNGKGNYCFPASWAIACELQCWICIFFICYVWNRWSKWIALGICGVLLSVIIAMNYWISWHYDLNTVWLSDVDYDQFLPYFFIKPYVKGIFSITGFLAGKFYLQKYEFMNKFWLRISLTAGAMLISTFTVYVAVPNWYDIYWGYDNWSRAEQTWIVGSRNILMWMALCMGLVPIFRRHISFATRFMSTETLDILGRLTYSACLLNWIFCTVFIYALPQAHNLNENYVLKFTFVVTAFSWIAATPFSIFVEQPFIALVNRLKGRPMHQLAVQLKYTGAPKKPRESEMEESLIDPEATKEY